ncbi:MAG TPA: pyridoxal-phosphate dependent enzyme [Actinomycetota bacterium]|nr:pyridoxal-phosphate dependent enzyme [Actinomycetota bacterium]
MPAVAGGAAHDSILDAIGNTPVVRLSRLESDGTRLYAKLEGQNPTGSVKDRIALAMVLEAERQGQLDDDRVLLEPSSGNTGISLALVCRLKGLRLAVVMPESASEERRRLLELYGVEVHLSPGEEGTNGAIKVAQEMASDTKYLMLNQYENAANPAAHEVTAAEIVADVPDLDLFVAGLGTGGTLTGAGRALKRHNPDIKVVAAEPPAGDLVQGLRSLEDGYIPPILDQSVLDRKFMVGSADAFRMTRTLFELEGVFAGISSGAAVFGALRAMASLGSRTAVVLLADGGWKYVSTGVHVQDPEEVERRLQGQIWW